jgi:N-acetylglucosaminyldiphosphoundecaprenol N-acetyl-beta-D-mannosaminyltransferase
MATAIDILGVRFRRTSKSEVHERILRCVERRERAVIPCLNAHALNLAHENPWLCQFLNEAHAVIVDGYGVVLAAWLLGMPLPQRFTYADWMWELAALCEMKAMRLYLLGARPGVAQEAARRLRAKHRGLKIAGTHHGYFDKSNSSEENQAVVNEINGTEADILVVGFGMPLQEQWLLENWPDLNARVALTGGGVFDYVSGRVVRPPSFLANNGLEWLGRLLLEPRRLWRRYLIGNPLFLWRILQQRFGSSRG